MKTLRPFIKGHIKEVLQSYEQIAHQRNSDGLRRLPFDSYLRNYYKIHKTLGPSERSIVSEALYKYLRNNVLLDFLTKRNQSVEAKVDLLTQWDQVESASQNINIPLNIRCSCPKELFDIVSKDYGEHTAYDFFQNSNSKAPLTIRVNPIKTQRDQFLSEWRRNDRDLLFKKTDYSPYGIIFTGPKQTSLQDTDDFRDGLFEIQDEASQLCSLRVQCKPRDKVLDYCAGSGGKSLAFAHQMDGTGQIILHDVREDMLEKAKKRCSRAGLQNIVLTTDYRKIKGVKYDWILLDVPCTGVGTLRRNPDMKFYFNQSHLDELVELQQKIFDNAIKLLKKDGKLVYVTCSFLKAENQEQISRFCNMYDMKVYGDGVFQSLPKRGGMDSFFSATLEFN